MVSIEMQTESRSHLELLPAISRREGQRLSYIHADIYLNRILFVLITPAHGYALRAYCYYTLLLTALSQCEQEMGIGETLFNANYAFMAAAA